MWLYEKKLQYPVKVSKCDPHMAKLLLEQYGGADGELAAALRYLNQRYSIPDKVIGLLTDIGTEEFAHLEMIATMVYKLTKDASVDQLKAAGLDGHYVSHDRALFLQQCRRSALDGGLHSGQGRSHRRLVRRHCRGREGQSDVPVVDRYDGRCGFAGRPEIFCDSGKWFIRCGSVKRLKF